MPGLDCFLPSRLDTRLASAFLPVLLVAAGGCRQKLTPLEMQGGALYRQHCYDCHELPQEGLLKSPPRLAGLFDHPTLPDHAPATGDNVREVIVHGLRTMPAFDGRLTGQETSEIVAYLHTLH